MELRSSEEREPTIPKRKLGISSAGDESPWRSLLAVVVAGASLWLPLAFLVSLFPPPSGQFSMIVGTIACVVLFGVPILFPVALLYWAVNRNRPTGCRRLLVQVHLSTCLLLMFLAGLLIWANVASGWTCVRNERETTYMGWPLSVLVSKGHRPDYASQGVLAPVRVQAFGYREWQNLIVTWTTNAAVGLAILLTAAIMLERLAMRPSATERET